jgi:hypothetical protein
MKDNLILVSKIAGKSFLKWLLIVVLGTFISVLFFLILLFQNFSLAGGGHGNALAFIINFFFNNLPGFILFVGAPIFLFLYFMIANKISIQEFIHQIYKNKAGDVLESKVTNIVDKVTDKNDWLKTISNETLLRAKLLETNRLSEDSSKVKKKAIAYLFKKISLNDIDFTNKDLKLSNVISSRLNNFILEKSKPSFLLFWILVVLQIVLFIWAQF